MSNNNLPKPIDKETAENLREGISSPSMTETLANIRTILDLKRVTLDTFKQIAWELNFKSVADFLKNPDTETCYNDFFIHMFDDRVYGEIWNLLDKFLQKFECEISGGGTCIWQERDGSEAILAYEINRLNALDLGAIDLEEVAGSFNDFVGTGAFVASSEDDKLMIHFKVDCLQ